MDDLSIPYGGDVDRDDIYDTRFLSASVLEDEFGRKIVQAHHGLYLGTIVFRDAATKEVWEARKTRVYLAEIVGALNHE